jgi:hypothetical protein
MIFPAPHALPRNTTHDTTHFTTEIFSLNTSKHENTLNRQFFDLLDEACILDRSGVKKS